jgi:hypothetical protein
MSIQYKELLESRTVNRDGESFTASRTFLVYDSTESAKLTATQAVNYHGGVSFSTTHPEISSIYANSFTVTPMPERRYTYKIVWSYAEEADDHEDEDDNTSVDPDDDGGILDPPTGDEQEQSSGEAVGDDGVSEDEPSGDDSDTTRQFNGVSITTGLALVDGFVAGATIPSDGTEVETAIADGTVVHEGGEPVTVPIPTTEISLSETRWGAYFYFNDVQTKAGKRNESSFFGFDAGSVIFKGMSVQRQEYDKWDVTYTFAWDAWSHMRQVPKRTEDGDTDWNDDDPVTLDIFFKQPFPDTVSFSFAP